MALLDPDDEAVLLDPSYPNLEKVIRLLGGYPVRVPYLEEEGWRLDLHAFSQALSLRTKMVVVVCPNNPTGTVLNGCELRHILDACRDGGLTSCSMVPSTALFTIPLDPSFPRSCTPA